MSVATCEGRAGHTVPGIGRVVRRIEFDHRLAQIAASRGVVVIAGARADAIDVGASGVSVATSEGSFRGRALIGADGVGSVVRRALGLPFGRYRAQVIEIDTVPIEGDPDRRTLHFDLSDPSLTGYAWDFPTLVDGRELCCRGMYELAGIDGAATGPEAAVPLQDRFSARLAAQAGYAIELVHNEEGRVAFRLHPA